MISLYIGIEQIYTCIEKKIASCTNSK